MILQRLTLDTVAEKLGLLDRRAAERWCKGNGVTVCYEKRRKFVMNAEIEMALQMIEIKGLKQKYPENYEVIYKALRNEDYMEAFHLINPDTNASATSEQFNRSTYVPKSKSAQDFLKNI